MVRQYLWRIKNRFEMLEYYSAEGGLHFIFNLLKFITLNSGLVFFKLFDKCLNIGFGLLI